GIRDRTVTGVQTCALPICVVEDEVAAGREVDAAVERRLDLGLDAEGLEQRRLLLVPDDPLGHVRRGLLQVADDPLVRTVVVDERSEERRVGKERRSRGWRG